MKAGFLFVGLICSVPVIAQQHTRFAEFGIDYRQYPIDIEDVPRGGIPANTYGDMTGNGFWQVLSIHGRVGLRAKHNWQFSAVCYTRYNHNHFLEDPLVAIGNGYYPDEDTRDKERIKFDLFIDVEKKIPVWRNQQKYLTVLIGLGLTNINSQTDFTYRRKYPLGGIYEPIRYKGSFLHFGPRASIGYQYKKFKLSVDGYIMEDPFKTNLTSLWLGVSLSYEIYIKKKKNHQK